MDGTSTMEGAEVSAYSSTPTPPPESSMARSFYTFNNDLIFLLLLLLSTLVSYLLCNYASIKVRRRLDGFIGMGIAALVSGRMVFCSMVIVIAHLVLLRLVKNPRLLTNLSFYGTFAYLGLLRHQPFIEITPFTFVTMMTLRAVGLSYEIADLREAKKNDKIATFREPTIFEAFNYLYCFAGLYIGPYYSYKTYSDSRAMLDPIPWSKLTPLIKEKWLIFRWSLPGYILISIFNPVNAIRGQQIDDYTQAQLFIWTGLAYLYLRLRAYSAWIVTESSCILVGIGVYPRDCHSQPGKGPTNEVTISSIDWSDPALELDAETISNMDIVTVEHCESFRTALRAWNRTVQWWMANFVYHRTKRSYRLLYTMIASAYWHPHYLGYFLAFLSFPFCTAAEDQLFATFPERPFWLRFTWGIIRMRGYEMMMAGQMLLDGWDTLHLWSRMYFWLHLMMLGIIGALKIMALLAANLLS